MTKQLTDFINYSKHLGADSYVQKWVENTAGKYIRRYKPKTGEVEHIIDFLVSGKAPKRIAKMSYTQARKSAEKWTKALQKKGEHIQETDKDTEVVLDFKDGFKIVRLIGQNAYKREGFLMRNCVADYYGRDVDIYSLRDAKNQPHCTIEKNQKIRGKGNGYIHPKYVKYVINFLEYSGMQVQNSEIEYIGYKPVKFPQYCENKLFKDRYIAKNEKEIYSKKKVIIFKDIEKAVKYKGNKACLFDGDIAFRFCDIHDLGKIVGISGNIDFIDSWVTSLGGLKTIAGGADFRHSSLNDLGELELIGGNAYFSESGIENLGKLRVIGGDADFTKSKIKNLGCLTSIGGNAWFRGSKLKKLNTLKFIGGHASFENSRVEDLCELETVMGDLSIYYSKIKSLGKLRLIGGDADLSDSQLEDLGELRTVLGYIWLENSEIRDLGNLEIIGGEEVCFTGTKVENLGKLRVISGDADFKGSKIVDLNELRAIEGNIFYDKSQKSLIKKLKERKLLK